MENLDIKLNREEFEELLNEEFTTPIEKPIYECFNE